MQFACMWNGITLHFPPLTLITVTCSPEDHISPTLLFLLLLACDKRRSFLSLFYPQGACIVCFIHILPEFSVIVADFQGMSSQVQSRSCRSFFSLIAHMRIAGDGDHGTIVHSISTMLTDRCILMQLIMEYFPFEVLLSSPLLSRRLSPAQCPGPQL